jgi:excisionase family DNA binding protein
MEKLMVDTQKLITPGEAARRIGVHPSTLYVWRIEHYSLPFVMLGKTARYRAEDVEKFLAAAQHPVLEEATA